MKLGIVINAPGVGDLLQFSALPENFFVHNKEKLVDEKKLWIFDYNPYVLRDVPTDKTIDLWHYQQTRVNDRQAKGEIHHEMMGIVARTCAAFDVQCTLRHTRLYRFEDSKTVSRKVVVHTNGKSEGGVISDKVINKIYQNYYDYDIYQIGGKSDKPTPFKNLKGLGMWETAEQIASAEIFIGVNSSMMHIANAYPKVRKKILVTQYDYETLKKYRPTQCPPFTPWIDYNCELYNEYDIDIGATMSYNKI